MEENKKLELEGHSEEEKSSFDFQAIYQALILNWYWFVLSLIICVGLAFVYLRYTTPTYQAVAKFLIKDDDSKSSRGSSSLMNASSLGLITNNNGIDNEIEILGSHDLAAQAVRELKLYVTYLKHGRIKDVLSYKSQPIVVDVDAAHLEKLNAPISLSITREKGKYVVTGTYSVPQEGDNDLGPFSLNKTFSSLPAQIPTRAGNITIQSNGGKMMADGETYLVTVQSPKNAAYKFAGALSVSQTSKTTTIAALQLVDESPERAIDYLKELALVYNRQANEDKNEVAIRTEKFINTRLEKINNELGQTESQLENYKQRNGMVELKLNATQSVANQNNYEQKLNEAGTQIALLNSIADYMNEGGERYQVIPSNVGLTDQSSTMLINKYNDLVLERNRLLRSASENSPVVSPITEQIKELRQNIRRAIGQARQSLEIQRNALLSQYSKYNNEIAETPQQERMLTQIGRQQEVKSGLYLMLLQKREENSISLAATADKGQLIDEPMYAGQVSPKRSLILLIGLVIGLAIPSCIIFLINFFRYRIEGHEDVAKLTALPIIADVAVASDNARTKADIVVHENTNNQMEEIFRSLRTNLLFMFKKEEKVAMVTSSTSGEGKTFICSNLAVSLALLGKKTLLVGLDIRRPRLAELFEIKDHKHGITPLLVKDEISQADLDSQIIPSGVNNYLDLLMAGPIPPNPTELISRSSLDKIFELARQAYDYIIVDTAPIGLVTDTMGIGRIADASIFVCRADYTAKRSIEMLNALAEEKKLPNMSIVINGIDMSKRKNSYYYGYGQYGKYGRYSRYGSYGHSYGHSYYGSYGNYTNSHYGKKNDNSVKR